MDNGNLYAGIAVAVMAAVTMALRFLPFVVFRGRKETPAVVAYFGRVLPYATMSMLVVFCLKNTDLLSAPHGLPELAGCVTVAVLHAWKRNTLLSVIAGTVCYMLLIQGL